LNNFLCRQGFDFPEDPDVAHKLRGLLPRLAVRSLGKGRGFWAYNLANLERARETLLGNFDQILLRFLTQPALVVQALKDEQLEGFFFAQLESSFGLAAMLEDEPPEVAARLTAQLVFVWANFISKRLQVTLYQVIQSGPGSIDLTIYLTPRFPTARGELDRAAVVEPHDFSIGVDAIAHILAGHQYVSIRRLRSPN
jgi:hypothetical protein